MASVEDVKKLAALARLDIKEDALAAFAAEFEGILKYVGQLETLSLDAGAAGAKPALRNAMREDGEPHESGLYTEKIAEQFPARTESEGKGGTYLEVKQIISHD